MKPSDVEYCPLHFQPCHILDYYVNTRVMRFANFPEVVRGSRKVCKNREIAHCYCITTWKVVVAKYYEVARRSAKFRARVNVWVQEPQLNTTVFCSPSLPYLSTIPSYTCIQASMQKSAEYSVANRCINSWHQLPPTRKILIIHFLVRQKFTKKRYDIHHVVKLNKNTLHNRVDIYYC